MKQARFWDYRNGLVKIKINAGQTLRHYQCQATDEGWRIESVQYYFNEDWNTIECDWYTREQDCDGRLDRDGTSNCWVVDLAKGMPVDPDDPSIRFPAWEAGEFSQ